MENIKTDVFERYELESIYDSRKSFYGKAHVTRFGDVKTLTSYATDVAWIDKDGLHINGLYSNTTIRHIREFIKQNGSKDGTSKELLKMYGC